MAADTPFLTPDQVLDHWQGHRRLTRRVIEAFPDDEAFTTFSIGGMRPFAELVSEMLHMTLPIARGVATGEWTGEEVPALTSREQAVGLWDEATEALDRQWAELDPARFQETHVAFGQWEGPGHWQILYAVDNETHHRAQGYVYLRALGVEPPMFPDRS